MIATAKPPNWYLTRREGMIKRAEKLPFPSVKDENYRHTRIDQFMLFRNQVAISPKRLPHLLEESADDEALLVSLKSTSRGVRKSQIREIDGVWVGTFQQALVEKAGLLKEFFERLPNFDEDKAANLIEARADDGVFIHISQGVHVTDFVRIVAWFDELSLNYCYRLIVVLEEGASVRLSDEWVGSKSNTKKNFGFVGNAIDFLIRENASLEYNQVQNWGEKTDFLSRQRFVLEKGASLKGNLFSFGGRKGQYRIHTELCDSEAVAKVDCAIHAGEEQSTDLWLTASHSSGHTLSESTIYSVVKDRAQAVFNGRIVIPEKSPFSDAAQKSKSLILSDRASANSFPKLEIATDEVKCAHGASMSPLDQEQIFYFQARGIDSEVAEQMIVRSFSEPVVQKVGSETLRRRIRKLIFKKFDRKFSETER